MPEHPCAPTPPHSHGDMDPEEFRRAAHQTADWMADYLAGVGDLPVLAPVRPGEITAALPARAPETGEPIDAILSDFRETILPGVTHWNHPGFLAYFGITGSGPGILGEMLAAALNTNAMLWRTGPAATELEERALDWLRQMIGLPPEFRGSIQDTASTSTLAALAAAREAAVPEVRNRGMSGGPILRVYASEEAHSSVERAGIVLGIGREGTRRIPTDERFRMEATALRDAVREDVAAGWRPLAVVATVGTTSTTSIDPVPEIAEICAEHGLWLHVDAAYGGAMATVPEWRDVLAGCERADSLVVNPHKWLFVPVDCSALFFRQPEIARRSLSLVPDYLQTPEGATVTNLMDYGPALGRRFRALKLWMTLRYFGREGIAARIREHCRLAREFAGWVDAEPGWERLAPVPMSVVVFRFAPTALGDMDADALNERILEGVNAAGRVFLSHTRVRGQYALRVAVGNLRTEEADLRAAWEALRREARRAGC